MNIRISFLNFSQSDNVGTRNINSLEGFYSKLNNLMKKALSNFFYALKFLKEIHHQKE